MVVDFLRFHLLQIQKILSTYPNENHTKIWISLKMHYLLLHVLNITMLNRANIVSKAANVLVDWLVLIFWGLQRILIMNQSSINCVIIITDECRLFLIYEKIRWIYFWWSRLFKWQATFKYQYSWVVYDRFKFSFSIQNLLCKRYRWHIENLVT